MSGRSLRTGACLATICSASLILVFGVSYGIIELTLFYGMMAVGLFLLLLPILTRRSLASFLMPHSSPRQKLAHSAGGIIIFMLGMLYGRSTSIIFISACMAAYSTYEVLRWQYVKEPVYISRVMESLGSLEEELGRPYLAPVYAFLGFLIAYTFFPLEAASVSVIVLAIGDGVAPTAGRIIKLRENPLNPSKTLGGSLIGFLAALVVSLIFAKPIVAFAGCAVGMLVECLPIGVDDNFSVPVAAVMGATLFGSLA